MQAITMNENPIYSGLVPENSEESSFFSQFNSDDVEMGYSAVETAGQGFHSYKLVSNMLRGNFIAAGIHAFALSELVPIMDTVVEAGVNLMREAESLTLAEKALQSPSEALAHLSAFDAETQGQLIDHLKIMVGNDSVGLSETAKASVTSFLLGDVAAFNQAAKKMADMDTEDDIALQV